jgi:CBS domain containing-hemolysin-like protein
LDSAPPASYINWILASVPALVAAAFAVASWSIGALSDARRSALRETLTGGLRHALERYEQHGDAIEARWLVIRALGISLSALMLSQHLAGYGAWMPLLAAVGALVLYAIPAEVGRVLATSQPERSAPRLLRYLRPLELLFVPVAAPVVWIGRLAARAAQARHTPTPAPGVTESEVQMIVTEGELNGSLGHEQSEMIRNVLDFAEITAGELMVPRTQVHAIDIDTPMLEVLRMIAESEHSRYPVYRENIDNVIGVLHAKDLLPHLARGSLEKIELAALLRQPVVFVPESQPADSVLREMRAGKQHLAVVLDEFGGTSGILTLENLLEQIVGDIRDEHDVEEPPIVDLGDGKLLVDAGVSIGDLSRYLGAELPTDGDYHTLAGFIVAELGMVPEVGARLSAFDLDFEVKKADERRVLAVEITRRAPPAESILPRSSSRVPVAS